MLWLVVGCWWDYDGSLPAGVYHQIQQMGDEFLFQQQAIADLQRHYPDLAIDPHFTLRPLLAALFAHTPQPVPSLSDLRFLAELPASASHFDIQQVALRLQQWFNALIALLEHNEGCRLAWSEGVVRGRAEREGKVSLREYEGERSLLVQLVEECRYGVSSKSDLSGFLTRRRREVFNWRDDSQSVRNIREVHLLEMPEYYEGEQPLSAENYQLTYESHLHRLLSYQFALNEYLSQRMAARELQQATGELLRQDSSLLSNSRSSQLISYVWHFCAAQFGKLQKLRNNNYQLRRLLINSVLRVQYLVGQAKFDVAAMQQELDRLEANIVGGQGGQGGQVGVGRTSVGEDSLVGKIVQIQNNFTSIFTYLTDHNETIFLKLYPRKLNKRVAALTAIEDRLTHFYKLKFNPDYALRFAPRPPPADPTPTARSKLTQLGELFQELRPLNDNQFRLVFEEVQRAFVLFSQLGVGQQLKDSLLQLENDVMREFLYDAEGHRRKKAEGPMERFSRSRVSHASSKNKQQYQVAKEEVFEETLDKLGQKSLQNSRSREETQTKEQIIEEGRNYIASIKEEFGEEFMDLLNFKAYLIPKLTQKVEAALSQTAYSDQHIYLPLKGLQQNLQLLPALIRPQINEQKIELIFYPRVDPGLFSVLKTHLLEHQAKLREVSLELSGNPIRNGAVEPVLKAFMGLRLRYLAGLLENIDKLEEIAQTIGQLNLGRDNYDPAEESTYNLILKLLLAEKEIQAYQQALRDLAGRGPSPKAHRLLADYIYPRFLSALLLPFAHPNAPFPPSLQTLLDLCDHSRLFLQDTAQFFQTVLRVMDDLANRRQTRNIPDLLLEFSLRLRALRAKGEGLLGETRGARGLRGEAVGREMVRVEEFLEISERGRQAEGVVDEGAKKYLETLRLITA